MSADESHDINMLRQKLEECDRDLVWLQRDYEVKESAYSKAKSQLESKRGDKARLQEHLRLIVLNAQERKEQKLSELLARMHTDEGNDARGAETPAAAAR